MNNQNTINNLYLCHFNPNHDPRNGQFAKSPGGSIASKVKTTISGRAKKAKQTWDGLDEQQKRGAKVAGAAAAMAGLSALMTIRNFKSAQKLTRDYVDPYLSLSKTQAFGKGVLKAGQVATGMALVGIAQYKVRDLYAAAKESRNRNKESGN